MKALLGMLLALPFTASATVIYVDYEGVVSSSNDAAYLVGDAFSGSLTIDTAAAPADLAPENGHWGLYGPDPCQCTADFVAGFQTMPGARASDLVNLNLGVQGNPDYGPWGYDQIDINDMQGNGTANRTWLELTAQLPGLLDGDGLVQSFEVSSPQGVEGLFAKLEEGWGAARTTVRFALSRFSMTPTPGVFSCHR